MIRFKYFAPWLVVISKTNGKWLNFLEAVWIFSRLINGNLHLWPIFNSPRPKRIFEQKKNAIEEIIHIRFVVIQRGFTYKSSKVLWNKTVNSTCDGKIQKGIEILIPSYHLLHDGPRKNNKHSKQTVNFRKFLRRQNRPN